MVLEVFVAHFGNIRLAFDILSLPIEGVQYITGKHDGPRTITNQSHLFSNSIYRISESSLKESNIRLW